MPKKIVIADDDLIVIKCVEVILQHKGYEVISARDGVEALEKIKKENPDLVILDIMMPEKNGYDVCHELRANKGFDKVPIVILSSRSQEIEDSFGVMHNIEYASKPIVREVLLERIEYLLGEEQLNT